MFLIQVPSKSASIRRRARSAPPDQLVRDDLEHRPGRGPLVLDARHLLRDHRGAGLDHAAVVLILGVAQALRQPLGAVAVGVDRAHHAAAARVDAVVADLDAGIGLEQVDRPEAVGRDVELVLEGEDVVPLREVGFLVEAAVEDPDLLFDEAVDLDAAVERLEGPRGPPGASAKPSASSPTAARRVDPPAMKPPAPPQPSTGPVECDFPHERDRSRSNPRWDAEVWARVRRASSGTSSYPRSYIPGQNAKATVFRPQVDG